MLLALILASACGSSGLQEYIPQKWSGDRLVQAPDLMTADHLDRVERVLATYEVAHRRASADRLLIDGAVDRDTMWNFTTKANDPEWIRAHGGSRDQLLPDVSSAITLPSAPGSTRTSQPWSAHRRRTIDRPTPPHRE